MQAITHSMLLQEPIAPRPVLVLHACLPGTHDCGDATEQQVCVTAVIKGAARHSGISLLYSTYLTLDAAFKTKSTHKRLAGQA